MNSAKENHGRFVRFACIALAFPILMLDANETTAQAPASGESIYEYWCATCHAAGPRMPGTQALEAKYDGAVSAVLTERADLTAEFVSAIVRSGISVMPPFRKTEITDTELEALSAYIVATARRD